MHDYKAYIRLNTDGSVTALCIILDERQVQQAVRSFKRTHPEVPIVEVSVTRALAAMRQHRKAPAPLADNKSTAPSFLPARQNVTKSWKATEV